MRLKVGQDYIEPVRAGNRIEFSFDAPENLRSVILEADDFLGDINLNEIQLEQSTLSTPFVEPMMTETVASGLFEKVQGISYEITDPNSDTWASIMQTVEGSITTYHKETVESTVAHTIDDVIFGIRDIISGDQASFNLRLDGIQQHVKNQMYSSIQYQLADFIGHELEDVEGNINQLQNRADGLVRSISNVDGRVNTVQDTVDGTIQRISGVEGSVNTLQNTAAGLRQDISNLDGDLFALEITASNHSRSISNLEGNYNTVRDTVNSHARIINGEGGKIADMVMNDSLFRFRVFDEIEDAKSSVSVLSDSINLRSMGNRIYIGGAGILIDAESVFIGDSTQIANGVITNRLISPYAEIDGAKIATATIGDAQIAGLNVDKLTGNIANLVQANFNSISSRVKIDYSGLKIDTASSWDMYLRNSGMVITNKYNDEAGKFTALINSLTKEPDSLGIVANPGHSAVIGFKGAEPLHNNSWKSAISVDGLTGAIQLQQKIYFTGGEIALNGARFFVSEGDEDFLSLHFHDRGGVKWQYGNFDLDIFRGASVGFLDSGDIIVEGDGDLIIDSIRPTYSANNRLLLSNSNISSQRGVWIYGGESEQSGIFLGTNGGMRIRAGGRTYDMQSILSNL